MTRLGRVGMASVICLWLMLGVAPATASQSACLPTARAAATLAKIIRRDARQRIRRHENSVTVTRRCCGVRVLRVHYKVRATGDIKQASYVVSLRTKHGVLRGVGISESSTEAGYSQERGGWENTEESHFAIDYAPPGPNHGWSFTDSYDANGQTTVGPAGRPTIGLGSGQACHLPRPVPRLLYMEVLLTLGRAQRHVLSAPGRLPLLACKLHGS